MSTTMLHVPRRFPRRSAALLAVAALALVGAACSDDDGEVVVGGDGTTEPSGTTGGSGSTSGGFDQPTGADDVVVRVFVGGGFVPVEYHLALSPSYSLLGDGTIVEPAVVTAIYPGPAINPLNARHADEEQIQEILRRADDAGLLDGAIDYGEPNVADVPNTTVTVVVDGEEHQQTAYALGFGDDESSNLTAEQRDARHALQGFIDSLATIGGTESEPYVPTSVAVYTLGPANPDPQVPQDPQPWPLSTPPATPEEEYARPCLTVSGDDATTLLAALARANQATPWTVEGQDEPLSLVFRAIVPGDPECGADDDAPVSGSGPATTTGLVVIGDPTTTIPPSPHPTSVVPASGPTSTIPATSAAAPAT
jgi:hypothetical protein